ncbi:MAG TPA: class I SAM-dependent methyltransferase [Bosea sp. (in: a-proteobacteria)]|jgi:SAM-dependent methyltransferase|uniref:class I SAM-dependent methyltransferase n=1 Tax=Bosea sp. (in: a-proteobacteria) TaxID=1871050 RepID=UPI002E11A6EC|nr:class I SAM-dependent methyltransferase [Bosea sp. (in: a-proteobacteria)]
MTARDAATLDFYAAEAQAYADRSREAEHERIEAFAAALPSGARVLELGCGGGHDSVELLARGLDLVPTDGSPELAAQASERLGRPVEVLLFEDLDSQEAFDGIWAHACLLHVPRSALPDVLDRIHVAMKPGGLFYASYKAGTEEGRDRFGRYYNYPSPDWLKGAYGADRWQRLDLVEDLGGGYDGEPTRWLHVTAVKRA